MLGGKDTFTNCTFANYGTSALSHANYGTVTILDYYWNGVIGDPTYYADLGAVMRNCIVYGSLDSEIVCDATNTPSGVTANLVLDHCLLKMGTVRESFVTFNNCIFNQDPMFKNKNTGDFHLTEGSPAIGAADSTSTMNTKDLDDNLWNGGDLGCYRHFTRRSFENFTGEIGFVGDAWPCRN